MSWFSRGKMPIGKEGSKRAVPEGVFTKCLGCGEMLYRAEFEKLFRVCEKCGKHHTLPARPRIELLVDDGTFEEHDAELVSTDPLGFKDTKRYKDRIKSAERSSGSKEAIICGSAKMEGWAVELCVFEFGFLAGSMGSVVGEKITRGIERAIARKCPVIIVSCSGGARMQEGANSLMQMAKTSSALAELGEAGLPFFSLLTHPTAGGVTASFAMLGDVIIAEPEALICFAGPRVIEQTLKVTLPEGFQRSEFLIEHGFVDIVEERRRLKSTITSLIKHMSNNISVENRPS